MLPDRVSNPGPLTYESGVLPIALRDPALITEYSEDLYTGTSYRRVKLFKSTQTQSLHLTLLHSERTIA